MQTALAPREQQYVEQASKGLSDKEIARAMNCGLGGVLSTSRRARFKLNARNRVELIINAMRAGIIELSLMLCLLGQTGLCLNDPEEQNPDDIQRVPRTSQRIAQRHKHGRRNSGLRLRLGNSSFNHLLADIGADVYQTYDFPTQEPTA